MTDPHPDADSAAGEDASVGPTVRELPPATVERIAAGEVVTRPARVVAELVENSLDAGATRVDVAVAGDGTERIRVADDGCGMSRADAARAVEQHTTSKIRDADDLARATTLGFRGEALASVAQTATLDVTTSDGSDPATRVLIERGETTVAAAGRARGTTVEVRDLFYNRPARRDALAGPATEFGRVSETVARYALARPSVAFSLTHDGTETFRTPGAGLVEAVLGVYDRTVASRSARFDHETTVAVDGEDRPLAVEGLLAYPSTTRARRDHVRVAVNGRPVADDGIRRAVAAGYGSLLPSGREPVAVVHLSLPPETVDANVHPAKEAVAFRAREAVERAVETGVRDALTTADLRRSGEVAMDLDSSLAPAGDDSAFEGTTVVGQFRGTYLLCEDGDDLLVVDQHAAHERVNYERLRAAVVGDGEGTEADGSPAASPSATLDPPETVSLSPAAAAAAEANAGLLADLGFDVEPFGGTTVRVAAVPAPLGRVADADALGEVCEALAAGERPADAREDLLADLACHPSLKAGDALNPADATALLRRLGECERPYACPHGRPTVLTIDEATLARGFERGETRLG